MTKHRFREKVKSFFGSHVDPEKDEELKGTKAGIHLSVSRATESDCKIFGFVW